MCLSGASESKLAAPFWPTRQLPAISPRYNFSVIHYRVIPSWLWGSQCKLARPKPAHFEPVSESMLPSIPHLDRPLITPRGVVKPICSFQEFHLSLLSSLADDGHQPTATTRPTRFQAAPPNAPRVVAGPVNALVQENYFARRYKTFWFEPAALRSSVMKRSVFALTRSESFL